MRTMRLAAVVGIAILLASCGGNSSSSSTSTLPGVSAPRPVHDVAVLDAVSCATAAECVAVGATSVDGTGVVVPITNGVPGSPVMVDGTKGLDGVSCPTTTFCEAVGAGNGTGVAVPVSSGKPGQPVPVAGTVALNGVSCPTGPLCEAAGRSATQGYVVTLTSPTDALPVVPVAGTTSVNGIDCADNSLCQVVASTSNGSYNDVVATVNAGTPGAFKVVPPGTSTFSGISCPNTRHLCRCRQRCPPGQVPEHPRRCGRDHRQRRTRQSGRPGHGVNPASPRGGVVRRGEQLRRRGHQRTGLGRSRARATASS